MASEDKDYEQSALGQRVNELMDDGYDFGEAVKQAMSEGLKDGGSVGIEILFGPKRDNFRYGGDTMGGKNDKSKSSSGPDRSRVSAQQQSNHDRAMAAAQNDGPSFKDKVKSIITNPATQALGGAILTGGINLAIPGALDKLNKARMIKNAIDYAKYIAPDEAIEGELENIQTQGGISPYADGGRVGFFMGGPALEGEALSIYSSMNAYGNTDQQIADKLQSLGMYTPPGSTPDTPETTPGQTYGLQSGSDNFSPYNPDPNTVRTFKEDVRVMPAMEALQRNQQLTSMGIKDPFADEASLAGAYYGDMFEDTSNQVGPAKVGGFQKFKNTLSSAKTNLLNNPVTNAIGFAMNPAVGAAKGILGGLTGIMGPNKRAITENIAGNMGIRVNNIGQIVNTGAYNSPEGVMAGYNLNKIDQGTFDKRYNSIEKTLADKYGFTEQEIQDVIAGTYKGTKGINKTTGKFTTLADLYRNIQKANKNILDITNLGVKETERIEKEKEAKEKLARLAAEEAALKAGQAPSGGTWQGGGGPAYTGPGGVGGGQFTDSMGNTDYQDAYDPGGGEKDGGIIGYRNGGLATMFTRRR